LIYKNKEVKMQNINWKAVGKWVMAQIIIVAVILLIFKLTSGNVPDSAKEYAMAGFGWLASTGTLVVQFFYRKATESEK
jgi:hypothetical protein